MFTQYLIHYTYFAMNHYILLMAFALTAVTLPIVFRPARTSKKSVRIFIWGLCGVYLIFAGVGLSGFLWLPKYIDNNGIQGELVISSLDKTSIRMNYQATYNYKGFLKSLADDTAIEVTFPTRKIPTYPKVSGLQLHIGRIYPIKTLPQQPHVFMLTFSKEQIDDFKECKKRSDEQVEMTAKIKLTPGDPELLKKLEDNGIFLINTCKDIF